MKSLEIIENLIELKHYDLYCEMNNEYGSQEIIDKEEKNIDELQQIKQDLEVLEIIRKKKVDIQVFYADIKSSYPHEEQIRQYNQYQSRKYLLTKEEFEKIKQWLEVNENDR